MLVLRDTAVTDAGLQHLRLLKGPTTIYLSGTKVTEQGAQELQAALPDCRVSLAPPVNCWLKDYKGPRYWPTNEKRPHVVNVGRRARNQS